MNIMCLVKIVPDVENIQYDFEKNVLLRENVHQIVNPEDATALARALALKDEFPGTSVTTVTMAPRAVIPHLEDLVRRGVDKAILISDPLFIGSDTYVTSKILARVIQRERFDCCLSGTHSLDGGTAHVPAQIAESLRLPHLSNIVELDHQTLFDGRPVVDVDVDDAILSFQVELPAILSFDYATSRKLPYITYDAMNRDVADHVQVITNDTLQFAREHVGQNGSRTRVVDVKIKTFQRDDTRFLQVDDAGTEVVFRFLRERGFLQ